MSSSITDAIAQPIVVLDPGGAMLYSNQATLDYTGLAAKDLYSPNFRQLMFHPDDVARLQQQRKAALEIGAHLNWNNGH